MSIGTLVRAGCVGEVAWIDTGGAPALAPVLPLTRGEDVLLALTFDQVVLARRLTEASHVTLVLRDPRGTGSAFAPAAWRATPRLQVDPTGQVYQQDLIAEELRRFPPSRALVDSPMLCREHWWYLPRLIVHLDDLTPHDIPPAARIDGRDHLLVAARDGRPVVGTVRATSPTPDPGPIDLRRTGGEPDLAGPAVLFAQDASYPDLERWVGWSWRGTLGRSGDGLTLEVTAPPDRTGLPPTPGLGRRWRAQRELGRNCRRALAAYE